MNVAAQTQFQMHIGCFSWKYLSELACSEADQTICEPSAVVGLQGEAALCAWRFSVSRSQVCFKNCSPYCHTPSPKAYP